MGKRRNDNIFEVPEKRRREKKPRNQSKQEKEHDFVPPEHKYKLPYRKP